jgi:uroporphyrinogen-III synthase
MTRPERPVVVVTRADEPGVEFERVLASRGVSVEWAQTVTIAPPAEPWLLDAALARLGSFDWVAFTSAHAVDAVVAHPRWSDVWRATQARRSRLAVVGPATAARLTRAGHTSDLEAVETSGAGLASALIADHGGTLQGVRVLWPTSDIARREFADRLEAAGATLITVVAYRTVPVRSARVATLARDIEAGAVDAVAFFSPSAAASLASAMGTGNLSVLAGHTLVASLGPSTTSTLRTLGAPPDIEAQPHTALALAASLARHFGS